MQRISKNLETNIFTVEEDGLYVAVPDAYTKAEADAKVKVVNDKLDEHIKDAVKHMKLESLKTSKISQSKITLSTFLSLHPIQWTDGKYYSVTSEKQALLTSNLALYQISTAAGQPFKLT